MCKFTYVEIVYVNDFGKSSVKTTDTALNFKIYFDLDAIKKQMELCPSNDLQYLKCKKEKLLNNQNTPTKQLFM